MLPLVLSESDVFTFKFLFKDKLQDGMCYRHELFCRLRSFTAQQRSQVYRLSCKLAQHSRLVAVTMTADRCNLWMSLRDPDVEAALSAAPTWELPQIDFPSAITTNPSG